MSEVIYGKNSLLEAIRSNHNNDYFEKIYLNTNKLVKSI